MVLETRSFAVLGYKIPGSSNLTLPYKRNILHVYGGGMWICCSDCNVLVSLLLCCTPFTLDMRYGLITPHMSNTLNNSIPSKPR